ncbi:MAG TPA: iron dicitrate transport regulator FecR, partial [Rhodospirillaceae bacterium]|nr:iron dicitrate transport regulator FecR [Rhodospirillaceae bacterium]
SGNYRLDDPAAVVAALADVAGAGMVRLPGLLTILH